MILKHFFSGLYWFLVISALLALKFPQIFSDRNSFFIGFINHEYVNVMGVILAITLASLAQIHFAFNNIEEKMGKKIFVETRRELKETVYWLICVFIVSIFIVIVKPSIVNWLKYDFISSVFNIIAVATMLFYLAVLADITLSIFDIESDVPDDDE